MKHLLFLTRICILLNYECPGNGGYATTNNQEGGNMKRKFFVIFVLTCILLNILLLFIFSGNNLTRGGESYRWVSLNKGLYGGTIYCISIDPMDSDKIYAGTRNGVYKSVDGGLTWESTALKNRSIYSIQIDLNNTRKIYAGSEDGIYVTVNYGEDWIAIGKSTGGGVKSVVLDPRNSTNIYAGICGGIFVKKDSSNWVNISSNLSNVCIETIAINPTNSNIIFVGTGNTLNSDGYMTWGGIFMTEDGGTSWKQVGKNLINFGVNSIAFDPNDPNIIYAGTEFGVFKSVDGGKSFLEKNDGLEVGTANNIVYSIAVDPKNSQIIYAGTEEGVFKSENGGTSWIQKSLGLSNTHINCIAINPLRPEVVYAGTEGSGIFKSLNSGENWVPINNGLDAVMIRSLEIDSFYNPKNIYVGTNGSGLFKSSDGGQNWFPINNGLTLGGKEGDWSPLIIFSIVKDYKDSQTLYLGTNKGIFKSINAGDIWVQKNSGLTTKYTETIQIDLSNNRILYAGTDDFLFKSTDGGENWQHLSSGIQKQSGGNFIVRSIVIDPKNTQIIYTGTSGGLLKSIDGGKSWTKMNSGITDDLVYCISIDPLDSNVLYAGTSKSLFKSTNGGNNWKQLQSPALAMGFTEVFINSILIDPENTKVIYIGTDHGVFQSKDGGDTWSPLGLEDLVINSLVLSKGPYNIYAGTDNNGVYTYLPVDIEAPKLKILSPPDNSNVYTKKVEIKGIATDNVGVTSLFIGSNKVDFATDGTFVAEVELFEGSNIIKLAAYDVAGNRAELTINLTYLKDTISPNLQISYPFDNSSIDTDVIVVKGTVSDGESGLESITVNGNVISVNVNGYFEATLGLVDGINMINVIATDKAGNKTIKLLKVTYRKSFTVILQIGSKYFTVNGETRILDSPPIIKNGRTLLPIRAVVEALGGTVGWNAKTQAVTISLGYNTIILQIGNANASVNGQDKYIDPQNLKVVPEIINSRTMLPLRFVAESLGCDVDWDNTTKTITITIRYGE